jgi:short-subunit dehydrogenase
LPALARQQYNLIIVARSRERLETLAGRLQQSYGIAVEVVVADLTQSTALRTVEERVAGDQALELLVNNAGFGTTGPFARLDPDQEEAEIRLNVLALVRLTRAVLPGMIARGRGAIINVSSLAAFAPGPYDAIYGATKAFVNSFTEALHEELCGTGVHVQTLCPGFTYTEFQQRWHRHIEDSDVCLDDPRGRSRRLTECAAAGGRSSVCPVWSIASWRC